MQCTQLEAALQQDKQSHVADLNLILMHAVVWFMGYRLQIEKSSCVKGKAHTLTPDDIWTTFDLYTF